MNIHFMAGAIRRLARSAVVIAAMLGAADVLGDADQTAADERAGKPAAQLFAVQIKVGPNWDASKPANEQALFREHANNLKQLRDAGFIVLGARYADIGLLIFSASSAEEVRAYMSRDPAMTAGTFQYEVHPMNVFYPGLVQP